jgi:hypothetical protein
MEEELNECIVCFDPFDANKHQPMMLVDCGHSLCSSCLTSWSDKTCPLCRVYIENKPMLNRLVLSMLEKTTIIDRLVEENACLKKALRVREQKVERLKEKIEYKQEMNKANVEYVSNLVQDDCLFL